MSAQKHAHDGCVNFITAKTWKQPRCPSVGEQIYKMWYTKTVEYYSVQ